MSRPSTVEDGARRNPYPRPASRGPYYALAAAAFVLEMAVSARYGYHRDELYFIACFRHLAFGYVDQPPLTPILAGVGNALFHGNLAGFCASSRRWRWPGS